MKKRTLVWLILALVIFGGGAWMAQETNLFGGITLSPRAKQLAYLKEHEEEMANFVKSWNSKVESVQFDWDSMEVGQVGNGTPQGGGYMMTVNGRINNNKDTKFTLGFPLKRNLNEIPEKLVIIQMQPIRILKGNLWDLYD
ncbi:MULTISPECIES: hypothetical protein [Streptococcus]|jgi:hypothetical protein|uniref:Uncharacterized protein n=1 Tax=Streptococcus oralis TaxID=1303 RepID=A0A3R9HTI1_STROR|nr:MULTISPECIES: hypothetical protein [Streptococcus]MBS9397619.1 hypothetical protein [Streptococcus oralis]MCC3187680.1 hypothetical protein [Streptococcus oralis]OFR45304.1 hypothetical protein HMPREF2885_01900 [Streptococcus sp. HMSC062H02]RSI47602.1 hypothetical protein D8868_08385 [Streptococcus oralis]RSI61013.1 hypothetical protein D8864_06110 [Streptococcus oralis]